MDDDQYGDMYTDDEVARMDAQAEREEEAYEREQLIKHDREVLRLALDLLDRIHTAWLEDRGEAITQLLDQDVYDFLVANHPDWAPDEPPEP